MLYALLLPMFIVLVCLPETSSFLDCKTSCHKCRDGGEGADILEVYCSMCKECRDRLLDRIQTDKRPSKRGLGIGLRFNGLVGRDHRKKQGPPGGRPGGHPYGRQGNHEPGIRLVGPGGRPIGPGGRILGPGGRPLGLGGHPLGPGGRLLGPGARPLGPGEHPLGPRGRPLGPGGRPFGPGSRPLGPGGRPLGPGGRLLGPGGRPLGLRGHPIGPEGRPLGPGGQAGLGSNKGHPFDKGGKNGLMGKGPMRPSPGGKGGIQSQSYGISSPHSSTAARLQNNQHVTRMPLTMTTSHTPKIIKIKKIRKRPTPAQLQPLVHLINPPQQELQLLRQNAVMPLPGRLETIQPLPPLESLRPVNIGDQIVYLHEVVTARPAECPPPPPDCEEVTETILLVAVTTTTTTTTTTTATTATVEPPARPPARPPSSCPPYKCKKKVCCSTPAPPPLILVPPPPPMFPPPVLLPPPPPVLLPPPPPMFLLPPPPPPPILGMPIFMQQPYIPQSMSYLQCNSHIDGCVHHDYGYEYYVENEPQTNPKEPQNEVQNKPQTEPVPDPEPVHDPEPDPEHSQEPKPEPLLDYGPDTNAVPQAEDETRVLTTAPVNVSNNVEPENNDVYNNENYKGVSHTEILRDQQRAIDYYYLYIGVPKHSVNEFKNKLLRAGVHSNK